MRAYGRALVAQMSLRVVMLSVLPFVLSVLLWAGLLYMGIQPLMDYLQAVFTEYGLFQVSGSTLAALGLGALKTVIVPFIAMLLLLPLMILTALIFIGVAAMPAVERLVGARHFAQLQQKHGGSLAGSVLTALRTFAIFIAVWLLTMPLYGFPPLALVVHALLWGWMSSRVMAYDALAEYASAEERATIQHEHRWPLLAIGVASGVAGAIPGLIWVGGTVSLLFMMPFLAALSIWLYVLVFIFSGLWFTYYCLEALATLRAREAAIPSALKELVAEQADTRSV
ncbi:EI24 domain-containing protein [Oxalobacteraceae bacterium]|nr:EI24 domain-containing protein [Oxalobacteraceae bacterium]